MSSGLRPKENVKKSRFTQVQIVAILEELGPAQPLLSSPYEMAFAPTRSGNGAWRCAVGVR